MNLPRGSTLQVGFGTLEATTLDVRSDREIHQRTWPNVQARLPSLGFPSMTGIRSVTLSSGIQRIVRQTDYGGLALRRRVDEDVRVPFDVTVQWLGTLVTAYQGAVRSGRSVDPTGDTERQEASHRLTVRRGAVRTIPSVFARAQFLR